MSPATLIPMELRSLEAFVAVAEELHFGRAALRLRMAQSPLSQTIRKLERQVGAKLFDRNTRSVELTGAGHALLPHAYRILEEVRIAGQAARAERDTIYGEISIGFSGALNHLTLPPLTRALRKNYPSITVDLVGRILTGDAAERLHAGSLDLAFVGLPMAPGPWRTRLIARNELGVVLPTDHPLAEQPRIDITDLADEPVVVMPLHSGSSLNDTVLTATLDNGFRPRVVQEVPDPFIVMTLVGAGVGVTYMPECVHGITPSGTVFRPLSNGPYYHEHALAWREDNDSTVLRTVLELAEKVLPSPPDVRESV